MPTTPDNKRREIKRLQDQLRLSIIDAAGNEAEANDLRGERDVAQERAAQLETVIDVARRERDAAVERESWTKQRLTQYEDIAEGRITQLEKERDSLRNDLDQAGEIIGELRAQCATLSTRAEAAETREKIAWNAAEATENLRQVTVRAGVEFERERDEARASLAAAERRGADKALRRALKIANSNKATRTVMLLEGIDIDALLEEKP